MTWVSRKLLAMISPKYAANWGRHIAGAIASALITSGYLDKGLVDQWIGPMESAISGVILLLIVVATSIGNTEKLKK